MSETWYPNAVKRLITTKEYNKNRGMPILATCEHISAGTDSRGWGQNANNGSSFHFLIRVENEQAVVYQFMPIEWAAWGNGRHSAGQPPYTSNPFMPEWVREYLRKGVNPNMYTISIEHEGVTPSAALYTGPMLEATIALHKWLAQTVPTIKADRAHVIGHYQIDHRDRANCPGGPGGKFFPFDTIIQAMQGQVQQPPQPAQKTAIQAYFDENGGIPLFGLPLHEGERTEVLEDGQTYQVRYFERARLQWRPEQGVTLGRIGYELLKLRGEI